MNSSASEAEIP